MKLRYRLYRIKRYEHKLTKFITKLYNDDKECWCCAEHTNSNDTTLFLFGYKNGIVELLQHNCSRYNDDDYFGKYIKHNVDMFDELINDKD